MAFQKQAVVAAALTIAFLASACGSGSSDETPSVGTGGSGDGGSGGSESGEGSGGTVDPAQVTFYKDLAPLLYEKCSTCHHDGTATPISLITYDSAAPVADILAGVVAEHSMPPMPVEQSDMCNSYSNARVLSESEVALFRGWADAGALEGDVKDGPPLPTRPEEMRSPEATLDPGSEYTPSDAEFYDTRCFVVSPGLTIDMFLTEFQLRKGERRNLRQVIVYQPLTEAAAQEARDLAAAEAEAGYPCYGGLSISSEPVAVWDPEHEKVVFPSGTGITLNAGRDLIMQVHYSMASGPYAHHPVMDLRLVPDGVERAEIIKIEVEDLLLSPGEAAVESSAQLDSFWVGAATIRGVFPLMMDLGRTLVAEFQGDGRSDCVIEVSAWNAHWQNTWWYTDPPSFESVDSATLRCTHDTTSRGDEVTLPGLGPDAEFCAAFFYMTH